MRKLKLNWIMLVLLAFVVQGCVSREIVITSDPSGAKVRINDTYEGTTPMKHRFTHYQVFGIRLEKEGYRPIYAEEHVAPPIYERPGLDFVSEVGPWNFNDRREFHYTLELVKKPDNVDTVLQHAEAARDRVQQTAAEQAEMDKVRRERLKKSHRAVPLPLKKRAREAEEKMAATEQAATEQAATKIEENKVKTEAKAPAEKDVTPMMTIPVEKNIKSDATAK